MTANKELWNRVCITDPKAVKAITGKQYQGNSPKPYWIVERLTEEFGPCGIGWGFTILNERMERLTETEILHIAVVQFWYELDGRIGTLQQIGQTRAVYAKKTGDLMVDEDAPKKSVTDALVKCASYIGFAGDIFGGRWDDSRYVDFARDHYAGAQRPPERTPERVLEERAAWLEDRFVEINAAASTGELKRIVEAAIAITRSQEDDAAEHQILLARDAKLAKAKRPQTEGA